MFFRTEGGALTPEQRSALARYRSRWSAIRRSTEPSDRASAEEGVRLAYRGVGLAPPLRFVWCDSPVALARATRRIAREDGPNVRWILIDRLRRTIAARVRRCLSRRVLAEVEQAVNPGDPLIAAADAAIAEAAAQEPAALLTRYRRGEPLSLSSVIHALCGREGFSHAAAGPNDLCWLASYEYLRGVLGLKAEIEPLRGLWYLATDLGWIRPHAHTCWLSERPDLLCGDASDRLHRADGPALRFRDGTAIWAWRGVLVPRAIIEQPESITLEAIDRATNVEVRRCMIEIMTPQRYVARGGAVRVAEDETGVLWRRTWLTFDAWAAVEVINATPESDGTCKHFFLQVPPNLQTAREAVAWTYGVKPHVYDRLVMRT